MATVVEVVEHLDLERLDVFADVVFGHLSAAAVVLTTPNRAGAGSGLGQQHDLRRHQCVFGVLALESEPTDPRL